MEKPASGEDHNVYIYYPHSMVSRGVTKLDGVTIRVTTAATVTGRMNIS